MTHTRYLGQGIPLNIRVSYVAKLHRNLCVFGAPDEVSSLQDSVLIILLEYLSVVISVTIVGQRFQDMQS